MLANTNTLFSSIGLSFAERSNEVHTMPLLFDANCDNSYSWTQVVGASSVKAELQQVVPGADYPDNPTLSECQWLNYFSSQYLNHNEVNIWVTVNRGDYATGPAGADAIVWGTDPVTNPQSVPHEVGHYLGLPHVSQIVGSSDPECKEIDPRTGLPLDRATFYDLAYKPVSGGAQSYSSEASARADLLALQTIMGSNNDSSQNCQGTTSVQTPACRMTCTLNKLPSGTAQYATGSSQLAGLSTSVGVSNGYNVMWYQDPTNWCTPFLSNSQKDLIGGWFDEGASYTLSKDCSTGNSYVLNKLYSDTYQLGRGGFAARLTWNDSFCFAGESCEVGDVNADGRADVVAFVKDTAAVKLDDAWVSLAGTGASSRKFGTPGKWSDVACKATEGCLLGDVNHDGKADIIAFDKNGAGSAQGDVWVSLSSGSSFGTRQKWHEFFCFGPQKCAVGDVNNDLCVDIIVFTGEDSFSDQLDDVWVAKSNCSNGFGAAEKWHDAFCFPGQDCHTGDVNNDGRTDLVAFTKGSAKDVLVTLSNGAAFAAGYSVWSGDFCHDGQVCRVANVDGIGGADVIAFTQASYSTQLNDAWVGLASGFAFATAQKWHDGICQSGEVCRTGDVDADGRSDVVAFVRNAVSTATNDVRVVLSSPRL